MQSKKPSALVRTLPCIVLKHVKNREYPLADHDNATYQFLCLVCSIIVALLYTSSLQLTMSASTIGVNPCHPTVLNDELAALTLQLEEISIFLHSSKRKHPVNQRLDMEVAFADFQAELAEYKAFLGDRKLAESIGAAVQYTVMVLQSKSLLPRRSNSTRTGVMCSKLATKILRSKLLHALFKRSFRTAFMTGCPLCPLL